MRDWLLLVVPGVIWGASFLFIATFLIPPVALVLGVPVRGERVALVPVLGGAVCVAGAWLIRRAQLGPARPDAA